MTDVPLSQLQPKRYQRREPATKTRCKRCPPSVMIYGDERDLAHRELYGHTPEPRYPYSSSNLVAPVRITDATA